MVHDGPFHGTLMTYKANGNDAPHELRLANLAEPIEDGKVVASLYRLVAQDSEGGFDMASYEFLREIESGIGLIDMWITPEVPR